MEAYDVLIVQLYLFALFTTLVKQKTLVNVYRLLKLLVLVLFGFVIVSVVAYWETADKVLLVVKVVPLFFLVGIMVQTEVRLVLKVIGVKTCILLSNTIEEDVKEALINSVEYLMKRRIGALITFERSDSLEAFINPAYLVDAPVRAELLSTIFTPLSPMHDGAVVIKGSQVMCAGAYFPPSESAEIPKTLGSRHRAAIGISEQTDALTVIVSEQTGMISVAIDGYLDHDISKESLILYLEKYLQN